MAPPIVPPEKCPGRWVPAGPFRACQRIGELARLGHAVAAPVVVEPMTSKPLLDSDLLPYCLQMICGKCSQKSLLPTFQLVEHLNQGRLLTCPRCNSQDESHTIRMISA